MPHSYILHDGERWFSNIYHWRARRKEYLECRPSRSSSSMAAFALLPPHSRSILQPLCWVPESSTSTALGWEAPGILILTVLTARIYLHRERQENSPNGTVFLMLMLKQRIDRECIFPLSSCVLRDHSLNILRPAIYLTLKLWDLLWLIPSWDSLNESLYICNRSYKKR